MGKSAPCLLLFQSTLRRWARPQGTAPYRALCSGPLLNTPTLSAGRASSPRAPRPSPGPPSPHCMQVLPSGSHSQLTPHGSTRRVKAPLQAEAAPASVQGQEELTLATVPCKAATRRCRSKQTLQPLLQGCPGRAAQRVPGWWEGGCSGSGRCSRSPHQDFSAPCLAASCQLTQKSSSGQGGAG